MRRYPDGVWSWCVVEWTRGPSLFPTHKIHVSNHLRHSGAVRSVRVLGVNFEVVRRPVVTWESLL